MSNPLPIIDEIFNSGATVYDFLFDRLTGDVFNNNTKVFEAFNNGNWAQYAIPLTEAGASGYYFAAAPAEVEGYLLRQVLYQQSGFSPSLADKPPVTMRSALGENVTAIYSDPLTAPKNLRAALTTETQGSVIAGVITASSFPTDLSNANDGAYQGLTVRFITGACVGMAALIADYAATNGVLTLAGQMAATPSANDAFIIV